MDKRVTRPMSQADAAKLAAQLTYRIGAEAKKVGVYFDRYDPDFILGVIMAWLGERDLALTANGLRRIRMS